MGESVRSSLASGISLSVHTHFAAAVLGRIFTRPLTAFSLSRVVGFFFDGFSFPYPMFDRLSNQFQRASTDGWSFSFAATES